MPYVTLDCLHAWQILEGASHYTQLDVLYLISQLGCNNMWNSFRVTESSRFCFAHCPVFHLTRCSRPSLACVCVLLPVMLHKSVCPQTFDKLGISVNAAKILQLLQFHDHCWLSKSLLPTATLSWCHRLAQWTVCTCTVSTCRIAHSCLLWFL